MNDNSSKGGHVPRQGVDHLPGQLDLIDHAKEGAPPDNCYGEKPFEDLGPNVVIMSPNVTSLDLTPARILQMAFDADLESVVVVGYDKNGNEYYAATAGDPAETIWLFERSKHRIMRNLDDKVEVAEPPTKA